MNEDDLLASLLQEKPNRLLKQLRFGESYPSELAKKVDTTFSHMVTLINDFEEIGLVTTREDGRKKPDPLDNRGTHRRRTPPSGAVPPA